VAAGNFIGLLRDRAFAPGPILWCGDAPEALTGAVKPAAYCRPFDRADTASPSGLRLLGVRTPWDDGAFAGAIVTDYWRCVPAAVLTRMVQELVRAARCVLLLALTVDADAAGAMRLHTLADCRAALAALPSDYLWEEHVGSSCAAFLIYPFPHGMQRGSGQVARHTEKRPYADQSRQGR
jgi:hypothetical protein